MSETLTASFGTDYRLVSTVNIHNCKAGTLEEWSERMDKGIVEYPECKKPFRSVTFYIGDVEITMYDKMR